MTPASCKTRFTRGRVRELKNGHNSVTVQNRTHVYMNFFHHKDLGNHILQLCPKVVKHPVYRRWQMNEYGSCGGMITRGEIRSTQKRKCSSLPHCPLGIQHGPVGNPTRVSVVRGRRLSKRPNHCTAYKLIHTNP